MYRPPGAGNAIMRRLNQWIGPLSGIIERVSAGSRMARIVQKFGGTSVADVDRIKAVAQRVKREADAGNQVAVVVSAMSGVTNQLVAWTNSFGAIPDQRDYDVVVASGEQVTAGLTALALRELGVKARSFLGWQVPIETDTSAWQSADRGHSDRRARCGDGGR